MPIKDAMEAMCDAFGYLPTANLEKVAAAKEKLFGESSWRSCPCDKNDPDRFCISKKCRETIERDGVCGCRCFCKRGYNNV